MRGLVNGSWDCTFGVAKGCFLSSSSHAYFALLIETVLEPILKSEMGSITILKSARQNSNPRARGAWHLAKYVVPSRCKYRPSVGHVRDHNVRAEFVFE